MIEATQEDAEQTSKCLARIFAAVDSLTDDGFNDKHIAAALTMLTQGLGVTPEQYFKSHTAGAAIYDDFINYHRDDDGRALPPLIP